MKTLAAREDDKDPDRENEHLTVPIYSDHESAAVEPQSRVSDRSRSPQRKATPQRQKGKKNTAEVKKPRDLPKAKKHKPMDSDEDDEVPQNEPGTSSNTQPPVPVPPLQSGSTSSSQRTSTSTSSEDESADGEGESGPAIQSARSHDSGRTVLHPDLYILTDDEHWTVTPETHKYAAAAGSFCFVTTETGEQQDFNNLTTMPNVQRSLCLDEVIDDSSSTRVELPKGVDNQTRDMLERCMATCGKAARSESQEEIPCTKRSISPRKCEDTTSSLLKRNTSSGNPGLTMKFVISLMRKFKPKNCVTGRWVLTIKTDKKQGRRPDGHCEVSKTNRRISYGPIHLRPQDQDFG